MIPSRPVLGRSLTERGRVFPENLVHELLHVVVHQCHLSLVHAELGSQRMETYVRVWKAGPEKVLGVPWMRYKVRGHLIGPRYIIAWSRH